MELFGSSNEGMEDASQSMIYWFETLAAVINQLKRPKKQRLENFFSDWKNNKIPIEKASKVLANILNGVLKIAINDMSRASEDMTLGEFIQSYYNKLLNQKIVLKAKYRPTLIVEFGKIDKNGIKVYEIDRKDAKKKPTIDTDLEFERRVIIGEDIEPMLSMIKPKEVGVFSILKSMRYWSDIIMDFSKFLFIITISFLHREYLMKELNEFVNNVLLELLDELNIK